MVKSNQDGRGNDSTTQSDLGSLQLRLIGPGGVGEYMALFLDVGNERVIQRRIQVTARLRGLLCPEYDRVVNPRLS